MPLILNGSTGISGTDGSAATPAVQGTDTNTGMFFPAADQIAFAEGGVEAMRLDASGNVGIGTSSPDRRLKIGGAGASFGIDAGSGNLAIDPVSGGVAQIDVSGANALRFNTNSAERARITSDGNVLIGTASVGSNVSGVEIRPTVGGNAHPRIELNKTFSGTATLVSFQHNKGEIGRITCDNSSTAYVTSSDYRLKENVTPLTGAAARVRALKPSRFNFIADPSRTVDGFIAHEAAEVVPEAISGEKDAVNEDGSIKPQGIDQSKLVPLLTAALQEALTEIAALKARVAVLEAN